MDQVLHFYPGVPCRCVQRGPQTFTNGVVATELFTCIFTKSTNLNCWAPLGNFCAKSLAFRAPGGPSHLKETKKGPHVGALSYNSRHVCTSGTKWVRKVAKGPRLDPKILQKETLDASNIVTDEAPWAAPCDHRVFGNSKPA